ncbi:MAG: CDP-glucose 4,6-dehydratase [Zavarzinella sp.]
MEVTPLMASFWHGKRVLVTGHTGFKGAWLSLWLHHLGAEVHGYALPPHTTPNLFDCCNLQQVLHHHVGDILHPKHFQQVAHDCQPEIVLHLAAQALVRESYRDPLTTFNTNVMGTANVLNGLREKTSLKVVLAITTDKVYREDQSTFPYRENDPLGGHDPYSASKAAAELVIDSYREVFFAKQGVALATARAGNVIGGGDWSTDRLLPDAIRAWQSQQTLQIRRPEAIRPWQHVLEPLAGYLMLAEQLYHQPSRAGAYNFGPLPHEAATVKHVIQRGASLFQQFSTTPFNIESCVEWPTTESGPREAPWLALETAKARTQLGYIPRWDLSNGLARTVEWYCRHYAGENARTLCLEQIATFTSAEANS